MRNLTWNRFPIKNLLIDSLLTPIVESTYLHSSECDVSSGKSSRVVKKYESQISQLHCDDLNYSKRHYIVRLKFECLSCFIAGVGVRGFFKLWLGIKISNAQTPYKIVNTSTLTFWIFVHMSYLSQRNGIKYLLEIPFFKGVLFF